MPTELGRSVPVDELRALRAASSAASMAKTTEQGAATSVWCATSDALDGMGGVYCEDVDIAEAVAADSPEPRGVRPWAMDRPLAELLWRKSEEWTGARFTA